MSILIVEDNVISARMLEGILKHHQMPTYTARNGLQALQVLQEHNDVRLILLDLMMPEMDGFQFLDERNGSPQIKSIPVIVMTALADNETVRRVILKGCKHYVVKPIREDQLIPKIKEMMPTAPSMDNQILRGRFEVMEEMGLDESGYDDLFGAFHEQTRTLVATMESVGEDDFPRQALLSFSEDALPVCGQNTSKRLLSLSESVAVTDTRNYLSHLLHALDGAHERRQRIRARMSGQE